MSEALDAAIGIAKIHIETPMNGGQLVSLLEELRTQMEAEEEDQPKTADADQIKSVISEIAKKHWDLPPLIGHLTLICELHPAEGGIHLMNLQSDDLPVWTELGMLDDRSSEIRLDRVLGDGDYG